MRISLDVSSDKKVPIKVWKSSGSERRISGPWIQTGSALEEVSTPNARVYYDTFINTNNNSRPTSVVTVLMLYYPPVLLLILAGPQLTVIRHFFKNCILFIVPAFYLRWGRKRTIVTALYAIHCSTFSYFAFPSKFAFATPLWK